MTTCPDPPPAGGGDGPADARLANHYHQHEREIAMSHQPSFWDNAEVIHTYTRRQAIEDGVLFQVSGPGYQGDDWVPKMAAELGYKIPIAMTARVFATLAALWPINRGRCESPIRFQFPPGQLRLFFSAYSPGYRSESPSVSPFPQRSSHE